MGKTKKADVRTMSLEELERYIEQLKRPVKKNKGGIMVSPRKAMGYMCGGHVKGTR